MAAPQSGKEQIFEKYKQQLKVATNARDSVRILYYLFDLSDREGQKKYGWQLYQTAERANDLNTQIDMLRNLATFNAANDSLVESYLQLVDKIPNDEAKASTKTYILNQQINRKSRQPDDTALQTMLLDSITHSHNLEGKDIYDKISLLYQIIQYLGVDADGVLFKECLDQYSKLIENLPASDYPLKNQFYTTAAMIHSRMNGNPRKAIQYDRHLLEIIEQLQQMYIKKKRKFRNYDTNKFICYRRMMGNYAALTKEEIEEIHDSLTMLYERDSDVQRQMDRSGQAFAFYYMAIGDYEKALPAIKGVLSSNDLSAYQRQKYSNMLIEAAKAVGDNDTYVSSMEDYIHFSKEIDSLRKITMRREIMLRDSFLNSPLLYDDDNPKVHSISKSAKDQQRSLTIVSSVLAILLIIYAYLYVKLRLTKSGH